MMLSALALATLSPLACKPLPGWEFVTDRKAVNIVMFGEYHGTSEMPNIVAQAICASVRRDSKRPVVLALEMPTDEQADLDLYLMSDGSKAACERLISAEGWRLSDPRRTQAVLSLIETVRSLRQQHPVRVLAFDGKPQPGTSPDREAAMAEALARAAGEDSRPMVIVHTGAGHADKQGFTSRVPPFAAAAGRLPPKQVITLAFARVGGSFWGCASADGDRSRGCGAQAMPAREPLRSPGIVLDKGARDGFDGIYYPAGSYSPSAPASQCPGEPFTTKEASPLGALGDAGAVNNAGLRATKNSSR